MSKDLKAAGHKVLEHVIELQRDIHRHPEIGFDTIRTAGIVARELRDCGLSVRENVGRTGVVGDLIVPGATQMVAFRADMDALPMDEENDLEHKSTIAGAAHMCGHDAHTSMLLGAARALSAIKDSLPYSLRFIFQPNEESFPGGAPSMIADGCLDGVDRIYGMHVWPLIDTGKIGILAGPTMGQPDTFEIEIEGQGGHAAAPNQCQDPLVAGAAVVQALMSVVARNVDPLDSAVLSVTEFHCGSAHNVIAPRARIGGTIRSFKDHVGETVRTRLVEIATNVARAMGTEAEVKINKGYPVLVNDEYSCKVAAQALDGHIELEPNTQPILGGEDFAYYLQKVPGAFLFLGNRDLDKGIHFFCHHPRFQVDDSAMEIGVHAWLQLACSPTLFG